MGAITGQVNEYGKQANTKLDDITIKKLEEAFSIGSDVRAACFYADISTQTYYNWINESEELAEKFDRLREKPVLKAYQTVVQDLGTIETAKWYLERKRKNEFSIKRETEHTGDLEISLIDILKEVKDE